MENVKGFRLDDNSILLVGEKCSIKTVEGEIFDNVILSSTPKGKVGFMVGGEVTERVLDLKLVGNIEKL